jgi:thioredoxin 1
MAHEVTDSNFDELIKSNNIVIVDFWAEWCGPCRMVAPILDELDKFFGDQVVIGKLNVDDNPDSPEKYLIRNIPTILLFKNGELADKVVGALPKPALQAKIEALL